MVGVIGHHRNNRLAVVIAESSVIIGGAVTLDLTLAITMHRSLTPNLRTCIMHPTNTKAKVTIKVTPDDTGNLFALLTIGERTISRHCRRIVHCQSD